MAAVAHAEESKQVVPGLRHPVEIVRDRWGISHIYARNEHDLFFAQGYSAARDRLFQLELWRRRATGTMAEIQGLRALPADIGSRLLRFRGDLRSELNHYHPRGAEIIEAFVQGINAFIELTEREPRYLPIEFRILGINPHRWTPEIVVSRHNGLYGNVKQEVMNAQLVRMLGGEQAREILNLHPGRPELKPDAAIDLSIISDAVIENYTASRAAIQFHPDDVGPEFRAKPLALDFQGGGSGALITASEAIETARRAAPESEGSNNWVISGARTFSGGAMMANDPHRALLLPSLRYWVHLVAPGWNVIGAGEPALPGVSVGHNEVGAWGFTIFPVDQEDLFVYETDPANPSRYRYRDGWEEMLTTRESIPVRGTSPVAVELRSTRHGPVISADVAHQRAYALASAWLFKGGAPYLASLRIDQATSWAEFREACRFFHVPSENMIWADRDGHIGWQAVGLAPRRKNWNGLLPIPGDGRYEWSGFLPILDLPHVVDPPQGWFATANQDNLPTGYPFAVGYQWTDPFRFARIEEVLGSPRRLTLMDSMELQQDELALPARALVPLLRGLKPARIDEARAIERLLAWDFVLDKNSIPAALYATWEKHLKLSIRELFMPAKAITLLPNRSFSTEKLIAWLTVPDGRFGADPLAGRDTLMLRALDRALLELVQRLGPEPGGWRYGQQRLKHVAIKHPLSDAVNAELRARLDVGPLPRGGNSSTVNSTSDDDNQSTGASFRIIANTADWDASVGTNTPGQCGDPDSPHYRDLFEPWANARYFPVFFSRPKVESVAESKITLVP
jgi:penicillin amidase